MKTKRLLRLIAVILMAIMAGTSTSWAKNWNHSRTGVTDDGGGTYDFRYDQKNFRYSGENHWNVEDHIMWFKTQKKFDASKGNYYYEFELAGCFIEIAKYGKSEWTKTFIEGEVYVVTADGTEHRIGTWKKPKSNEKQVAYTSDNNGYGLIYVSSMDTSNGHFTIRYLAESDAISEGVNKIYLRQRLTFKDDRVWDWWQYEKAIDLSSISEEFPLPRLKADWGDDGKIHYSATDINVNDKMLDYYYWARVSFDQNGIGRNGTLGRFYRADESVTLTEKPLNKEDMQFSAWLKTYAGDEVCNASYTTPVSVYYRGSHKMNTEEAYCGASDWHRAGNWYYQPYNHETILPFTRPEKVNVTFDKWKKSNTVTWTMREKATLYDGTKYAKVECRTDGKWYVMRYDRNKTVKDYVLVGQPLRGDTKTLEVTDNEIDYDKEYVYRVVFLPKVLDEKYSEDLTNLPGQKDTKSDTNLWNEAWTSTLMEVPVRLAQDRTDDTGIHLVWEYNVQTSGCEWRIDKHRLGSSTWTPVATIPVDTKQSMASYIEEGGSVCDQFTYRIMTKINDKELYSDTLVCNLPAGAYISKVTATTGSEEKFVKVKWRVARPGDDDIWFRVLRRPIGSDDWTLLNDEIHGHATDYEFLDENVMAGSYYEYSVEAYGAKCEGQLVQTDQQIAPGFSQARGTITGHISYGTGTSVAGVRVNLLKSSADLSTDQPQFLSRYIEGEGKGLQWNADSAKYDGKLNGKQELTLQLWAKPCLTDNEEGSSHALLKLANALELGIKTDNGTDYYLYAADCSASGSSSATTSGYPHLIFDPYKFTHIAAVYASGLWTFYIGTDTLLTATLNVVNPDWNAVAGHASERVDDATLGSVARYATLSIGGTLGGGPHYCGFVDDIRLWNRALSQQEIETNYTRILGGTEKGLMLYWPLDEGLNVRDYVFDIACQDGLYQLNHPEVGINAMPSATVPENLGLYGLTDKEGDYIIRGIPFQQGGTNYKLAPQLGIHEFSPNTRSMFVSPTSLTANNIDFEDVSSFPMRGYIYYAGTNIPAEGVQFFIDGNQVTGNGEVKQTNENGYYEISVPIGPHYVEARLSGHTFVDGGRYPIRGTFNFDRAVQYDFADSTLVNFVGRVGGGERNDTLAVGFGASRNNIGMATIQLRLNNESFSFNCQDDHITDATTQRTWDSDTTSINSRAWTGTSYDSKYIYIRTDSLTGEFSAKIPPLKYITKSVRVNSNSDLEFASLPEIDLTNTLQEYTDEIDDTIVKGESASYITGSYVYHTKQIFTYFAPPQVTITEKANGPGAFGIKELEDYEIRDGAVSDTVTITDIWKREKNDSVKYLLNYPLYRKGDRVTYDIFGYEAYTNYDSGKAITEQIPLHGQEITLNNEMSETQKVVYKVPENNSEYKPGEIYEMESNTISLGEDGHVDYRWGVGLPNITPPYARNFSISLERNDRIYAPFSLNAVVLGDLPEGNNFVTKGPDKVQFVLRDPPGAKSKTTLKRAKVSGTTSFYSDKEFGDHSLIDNIISGSQVELAQGFGVMFITGHKVTNELDLGYHATWRHSKTNEKAWTTTYTQSVSTSTGIIYVGGTGDVFVGTSTNLLLGSTRNLCIGRNPANGQYMLNVVSALSLGEEVSTTFNYTAHELETVMIPKWKDQRMSYLTEVASKKEAKDYVNNGGQSVYLTWEGKHPDIEYVDGVNYLFVPPVNPVKSESDSVNWCTQQINNWTKVLRDNEQNKLKAMESRNKNVKEPWKGWENFSIDGGTSYNYSVREDTSVVKKEEVDWTMSGIVKENFGFQIAAALKFGNLVHINSEQGREIDDIDGDVEQNYTEWEYSIDDGNFDAELSIDKYPSGQQGYSDVFSLFGGQTYNPWEGPEVTKYYKPGTPLSNGSIKMEQPDLRVSLDGQNSYKEITVTDVPSGQAANLTLHCTNMANIHQTLDFEYDIIVWEPDNNNGLQILMDGVPINGRGIRIPKGETVLKGITVRQTDQSILDYEGVKIRFASKFQAPVLYDEITLNIHFTPSSSPINLIIADPVLNIETFSRNKGNLELKVNNFDRLFKGMKKVGVEYRFEGSTTWAQPATLTFLVNPADSTKAGDQVLPKTGDLRLNYNMANDNDYPQGNYTFRAYTVTKYDQEEIRVVSNEVTVVKDNQAPRQLTTPTPASGILRYGDDLSIEFNEDIVPGYVSDKNIIVTAKLNHQPVQHDVAKLLKPFGEEQRTVNPVFLNGDFSIDCWMLWNYPGTILRLGTGQLSLSIDEEGHIVAGIASAEVVSKEVLPKDKWIYFVLSYKATDKTFTALAQYDTQTLPLFTNEQVSENIIPSVSHYDDNHLYLGSMDGAIHDLSLFNIYRDVNDAAATKYQAKDNYVYGLANYWPLKEGHGHVAADTRHTHDFEVNDSWMLENENYSLRLDDNKGVEADISRINTSVGDSYAIEMWVHASNPDSDGDEQIVFEAGSVPSNRLELYINNQDDWLLRYGNNEQVVVSHEDFPYMPTWAHVALNVVRGQAASFYFNGERTAVIAERDVPPLEGARLTMGRGMGTLSQIDEVRVWHAALSENRLLSNMYNCIDTTDVYSRGLVAYYPFEKAGTVDGVATKVPTLENLAPQASQSSDPSSSLSPLGEYLATSDTPPLKNAPVETRIIAKPVASERKVVISLLEGGGIKARDVEGTTLNITVDKILDMHGNQSLPIRWQAYVQCNALKWTKDSVNVFMKYGDGCTFDVNIENKGGVTEYYTLYNMPEWLSLVDSERTDDISPLKTKTLRFAVSPLTPVGCYDITIGLQGNNAILEPLRIVLKVQSEQPAWTVDPTAYENSMTIVAQVYLDGHLMENGESIVAAFIDGECRGIASPMKERGAAYVNMNVYGTSYAMVNNEQVVVDEGKAVSFRIWDAYTGISYTDVNVTIPSGTDETSLSFGTDKFYGDYSYPVILTKSDQIEQYLALHPNWNWISISVEPKKKAPYSVFKGISSWEALLKNHGTAISYCNGTSWSGTLKSVEPNTMYKLQLQRLDTSKELPRLLPIAGRQMMLEEVPVTIENEWNWIAYTPMATMPIDFALAGAHPQRGDRIKSQTAFAIFGHNGVWEGELKALENGQGYMYYSTDVSKKTFTWPVLSSIASARMAVTTPFRSSSRTVEGAGAFDPVSPTNYSDNMTMVIQLVASESSETFVNVDTCEVAAFVDGECRGASRSDGGLYYLLIAGEGSGTPIELRTCIDGQIVSIDNKLTFSTDANIGTPWNPYVIDLTGVQAIQDVRYSGSGSVETLYDLQGRKMDSRKLRQGVYIRNGKKLVVGDRSSIEK